jgi:hypothetical protein
MEKDDTNWQIFFLYFVLLESVSVTIFKTTEAYSICHPIKELYKIN